MSSRRLDPDIYPERRRACIQPVMRRDTIDAIKEAIESPFSPCTYVGGRSGTGKSWILEMLTDELIQGGHYAIYYPVATSEGVLLPSALKALVKRFEVHQKQLDKKIFDLKLLKIICRDSVNFLSAVAEKASPYPIGRPDQAYRSTIQEIAERLGYADITQYEIDAVSHVIEFIKKICDSICTPGRKLVITIDQVENIPKEKRQLLSAIVERLPEGAHLIYASYEPKEDVLFHATITDVPLTEIKVQNFDRKELGDLLKANAIPASDRYVDYFYSQYHGFPRLTGRAIRWMKMQSCYELDKIPKEDPDYCRSLIKSLPRSPTTCLEILWFISAFRECVEIDTISKYCKCRVLEVNDILEKPEISNIIKKERCCEFYDKNDANCIYSHLKSISPRTLKQIRNFEDESKEEPSTLFPLGETTSVEPSPPAIHAKASLQSVHASAAEYYLRKLEEPGKYTLDELILSLHEGSYHAAKANSPALLDVIEPSVTLKEKLGNYHEAAEELESAVTIANKQGDRAMEVSALNHLRGIYNYIGMEGEELKVQQKLEAFHTIVPEIAVHSSRGEYSKIMSAVEPDTSHRVRQEVTNVLKGLDFPASKQDVLNRASQTGVSEELTKELARLPDEQFKSATDIRSSLYHVKSPFNNGRLS